MTMLESRPVQDIGSPNLRLAREREGQTREWWRSAVSYQIYPRSFQDSDGDGNGDIPGITQRMDQIADMGYDAIWITPIHKSPWNDGGYDVSSYKLFNPMFGNRQDVKEMVDAAHAKGVKVIFDVVMNHTSGQHPWYRFLQSPEMVARRKKSGYDYGNEDPAAALANVYHFRPVDPEHPDTPPNNWKDFHSGGYKSAWKKDSQTGEWVYGKFISGDQVDLNLRNPLVRRHMIKTVQRWMEQYGIDGVRMDVIDHTFEDPIYRDFEEQDPDHENPLEKYNWQERYLLDDAYEFVREIAASMHEVDEKRNSESVSVGEIYYQDGTDFSHLARFYTEGNLKVPFNFALQATVNQHGANAAELKKVWDRYIKALPEGACPNAVLANHDQTKRIADAVGPENTRAIMMMLLSLGNRSGSNIFIYMGDENGAMKGDVVTKENDQDPIGKQLGVANSRSHSRTGYLWNSTGQNGGYSQSEQPWLPVGTTVDGRGAEEQQEDPLSMRNFTKGLIHARKSELSALQFGEYVPYDSRTADVFTFGRQDDAQNLMVTINFSAEEKYVEIPDGYQGVLAKSTDISRSPRGYGKMVRLAPHEGCIISLKKDNSLESITT